MTVVIFNQPQRHRLARADSDDARLGWTACGIRFHWDPTGYRYAQRVTGNPAPKGRCQECAA